MIPAHVVRTTLLQRRFNVMCRLGSHCGRVSPLRILDQRRIQDIAYGRAQNPFFSVFQIFYPIFFRFSPNIFPISAITILREGAQAPLARPYIRPCLMYERISTYIQCCSIMYNIRKFVEQIQQSMEYFEESLQ